MFDREFNFRFTLGGVGKFLFLSPFVVLPIYGLTYLPWESKHAPGWLQAIGAILALIAAVAVPAVTHRVERARAQDDLEHAGLMVAVELKHIYEELAFWVRTREHFPWKARHYFEQRAKLLIRRIGMVGGISGVGLWGVISRSEESLCGLLAQLEVSEEITREIQEYAQAELSGWMTEALERVGGVAKRRGLDQS